MANEALDEDLIAENIDEVVENYKILEKITLRSIDKVIFENELKCPVCRKDGTDNEIECSTRQVYNGPG